MKLILNRAVLFDVLFLIGLNDLTFINLFPFSFFLFVDILDFNRLEFGVLLEVIFLTFFFLGYFRNEEEIKHF